MDTCIQLGDFVTVCFYVGIGMFLHWLWTILR